VREPSLKESALASVLIHALIFFVAVFALKRASHYSIPKTYTVKLVSPGQKTKIKPSIPKTTKKPEINVARIKQIKAQRRQKMMSMKKAMVTKKKKAIKKAEELDTTHVQQQIEKLRALKRVKRLAALKHEVLSISKASGTKRQSEPATKQQVSDSKGKPGASDAVISTYINMAKQRIWSEWVLPEIKALDGLETIVIIKILKDGKLKIVGIEKPSGDSLFDRSTLRAIMKASPLPPPPEELELGIRFQP